MEESFWTARWAEGRTGWHQQEANRFLREHWPRLGLPAGSRVLVPLCGKAPDLAWLAEQGMAPVGVELIEQAVADFYAERAERPTRTPLAHGERWVGGGVEIVRDDWFDVTLETIGAVDAWWDRAALIALPPARRPDYVRHLAALLPPGARGLLLSLEYPAGELDGPPFSVEPDEVERLFADGFELTEVEEHDALPHSPKRQAQGLTRLIERLYALRRL